MRAICRRSHILLVVFCAFDVGFQRSGFDICRISFIRQIINAYDSYRDAKLVQAISKTLHVLRAYCISIGPQHTLLTT